MQFDAANLMVPFSKHEYEKLKIYYNLVSKINKNFKSKTEFFDSELKFLQIMYYLIELNQNQNNSTNNIMNRYDFR